MPPEPIEQLKDLAAAVREHMTDEELLASKLLTDSLLYGFCAIDQFGNRINPADLRPVDS